MPRLWRGTWLWRRGARPCQPTRLSRYGRARRQPRGNPHRASPRRRRSLARGRWPSSSRPRCRRTSRQYPRRILSPCQPKGPVRGARAKPLWRILICIFSSQKFLYGRYYTCFVSRIKPSYFWVFLEPGELSLGVAPGVPLQQADGLFERVLALQKPGHFLITQSRHGLQVRSVAHREEPLCLFEKPGLDHLLDPSIYVRVKLRPVLCNADLQGLVGGGPERMLTLENRDWLSRELVDLKRPHDPVEVIGVYAGSALRVYLLEHGVESICAD